MTDIQVPKSDPLEAPPGPKRQTSYLRPNQIEEMEAEKRSLEITLQQPGLQEPGVTRQQLSRLNRQLAEQTPPDLTGGQRDQLAKEAEQLEDEIREGMPSRDEMMRNPSGTSYRHIAWEQRHKARINRWKAIQLALQKGSQDANIANIERIRPPGNPMVPFTDAQIGRKAEYSFPTDAYQANYEQAFRDSNAAEEDQAELEQLRAKNAELAQKLADAEETAKAVTTGRRRASKGD